MDETERIRKMVAAGTITDAEAERLLGVLHDIDQAEAELDASGEAMESEARAVETGGASAPATRVAPSVSDASTAGTASAAPASGTAPTAAAGDPGSASPSADVGSAGTAADTRWLHLSLLAGDIDIRSDPAASEVTVAGDTDTVRLEPAPDGYTLRHERDGDGDSWVDRFLSRLRSGHVRVRLPAGYGVDLNVTAGDVELTGVPYLRGRLTSGDLSARGLKGIDLVTSAGDIDVELTPTQGRHSLRATAGDVDIRLGAASSVAVTGSVSIGNASVRARDFEVDRRGIGQRFEGRVGDGAARLDLHVTTGNLHVKVDDDR